MKTLTIQDLFFLLKTNHRIPANGQVTLRIPAYGNIEINLPLELMNLSEDRIYADVNSVECFENADEGLNTFLNILYMERSLHSWQMKKTFLDSTTLVIYSKGYVFNKGVNQDYLDEHVAEYACSLKLTDDFVGKIIITY